MKFTASIKALSNAIKSVSRAIPARPTHPILANILIKAEGDTITLVGFDLTLGITSKLLAHEIKSPGAITLPAKILGDLLTSLSEGLITIEIKEDGNKVAHLSTGAKAKYKIPAIAAGEYPELPESSNNAISFDISVARTVESLDMVLIAVATEESKQTLCGVNVSLVGGNLSFAAIDGHRLALSKIEDFNPDFTFDTTIPARCLQELLRIAKEKKDGDMSIKIDDGFIAIEIGNSKIWSRLLEGAYPAYRNLIPNQFTKVAIVNRHDLVGSLYRVSLFSEIKKRVVEIGINSNELSILANNDNSEGSESIPIELNGEGIDIAFNIDYLIEGLKTLKGDRITLSMNGSLNPVIIESHESNENNKSLYLTMPVQLKPD